MLMLNEFKRNIGFFIIMGLVLTLLMSVGISIFNFSFEINREVNNELSESFEFGYNVWLDGFISPDQKIPGVDYYMYDTDGNIHGVNEYMYVGRYEKTFFIGNEEYPFYSPDAYYFEDYLPKNFLKAIGDDSNFIIDGELWKNSDNYKTDGKYPIFLSGTIVDEALENGIELKIYDTLTLAESRFDENNTLIEHKFLDFKIKGIYRNYSNLPLAVIPLSAELQYRDFFGEEIEVTCTKINDLDSFKEFLNYTEKNKIKFNSGVAEDLRLLSLFTSVFIVVSVAMLALSGVISFIYCGMFINRRLNFIGLIKALGLSDFKIARQLFILLLIVFIFSFILGNIFSYLITSNFEHLAFTLFGYDLNMGLNWLSQALFGILTILTALINTAFLYRKIKRISIAQILTEKD